MKISFAFRTRLIVSNNTFTICYAVVNLLKSCQQASFGRILSPIVPLRVGGLKWTFWHLVASQPSGRTICAVPFRVGGLKWTRTIDLTLIRRVL